MPSRCEYFAETLRKLAFYCELSYTKSIAAKAQKNMIHQPLVSINRYDFLAYEGNDAIPVSVEATTELKARVKAFLARPNASSMEFLGSVALEVGR